MKRHARHQWAHAPPEVLGLVFDRLDLRDSQSVRLACRHWCEAYNNQTALLRPKALAGKAAEVFRGVRSLDLSICKQESGTVALLQHFNRLTSLSLGSTRGLQLSEFQGLKALKFDTDADCSAIKASLALPCLVKLTISDWHTFDLPLHSLFSTASLGLTRLDIDKDVKAPLWNSSYKKASFSCQALSKVSSLQSLSLGSLADCSPGSLSGLLSLTALKSLSFANPGSLDSNGMRIIAQLTALSRLHILDGRRCRSLGASLTSDDAAHLASLKGLQSLTVNGCWWDKGISSLSQMSRLRKLTALDISHSAPSLIKSVLDAFYLGNLDTLVMRHSKCFAGDLLPLQKAVKLRHLDIFGCITQAVPAASHELGLPGLTRLRSLSISYSCSSPAAPQVPAACLGQLTSLEWPNEAAFLWASCWPVDEPQSPVAAMLQHADQLTCLQRLCIREQSLCPASSSLANLGKLTALTELDLSRVYCEGGADVDSLMAHLGSLSSLCKLSVASTAICGHGLTVIASLQSLTSLDLSCLALDGGSLSHLSRLPKLRELFLDSWSLENCISDADLVHVAAVSNLERLSLRSNWHVTNAGLSHVLVLPRLSFVDLRGCLHVHAETALRQFQSCTCLAELRLSEPGDLSAYSAVSAAELNALHSKLPYLRSVTLGGQIMTSKVACALAKIQYRLRRAALEVARAYLAVVEMYEAAMHKKTALMRAVARIVRESKLEAIGPFTNV